MASLSAVLLNVVLSRGASTYRELVRYGFRKEWLREGMYITAWDIIAEHIAQHGDVPSATVMDNRFPRFPIMDPEQTRTELATSVADLLRADYIQAAQEVMMAEAMQLNSADPLEALEYFHEQITELRQMTAVTRSMDLAASINEIRERYNTAKKGLTKGIDFPWDTVTNETLGMHPEDFILVYGMKKNMKTFVALHIATWAYFRCAARVLVVTRELSIPMMLQRAAAFIAGVDYGAWRHGRLSPADEEQAFSTLSILVEMERENALNRPSNPHLGPAFRVADLSEGQYQNSSDNLEALIEEFKPDIVFDDGLYLSDDAGDMDWRELTKVSQGAKKVAKRHKVVYLATTQANKKGEFAFSQAFGQDCDLSMKVTLMPENRKKKLPNHIILDFTEARECQLPPVPIIAAPCTDFSEMTLEQMLEFRVSKDVIDQIRGGDFEGVDYEDEDEEIKPRGKKKPKGKKGYQKGNDR